MSTPVSGSPYIIICDSRIGIATATDEASKIRAASNGATMLSAFMQSHFKQFKISNLLNITALQHALMDHVTGKIPLSADEVEAKIKALVKEMYDLEKKYV